jgi:CYTH domain-containing protein
MEVDKKLAAALGFPKTHYMIIERERRWLCSQVPHELIAETEAITDLYVTGSRLRLREARPVNGSEPKLRLTRKADADTHTRLITSIYLPEGEFAILARSLSGARIKKLRHRLLSPIPGVLMAVDEFQGSLSGLILAEAEFETDTLLADFPLPRFATCEVTDDPRFTGSYLAKNGLPSPPFNV